jgi:TP901-1 family phage major tail protein
MTEIRSPKFVSGVRLGSGVAGHKTKESLNMAAQKGKDLLLKVDTTGAGVYITVAGLRARSLSISAETVEITNTESAGQWRELLTGAGVKSARITGSGVFKDGASDATIRDYAFNGTIRDWQIIVPDFGTIQGAFQITALEFSGRHDAEVTFDISLESAGALTFAAA